MLTNPQRILATTDLSAPSRHAVERAAQLAVAHHSALEIAHVLPTQKLTAWHLQDTQIEESLRQQSWQELHALAGQVQEKYALHPALRLLEGSVLEKIQHYAESAPCDLLVLGARGQGFLRHILLGSTAERLLRIVNKPMLVVRQIPHEAYRHILVAVDFSPVSARLLDLALQLAPDARITLLHAYDMPFEDRLERAIHDAALKMTLRQQALQWAREQMSDLLQRCNVNAHAKIDTLVLTGHPPSRILEAVEERDVDLVIIGKQGQDALRDFLLGSVSKHVLTQASCDVMVNPL